MFLLYLLISFLAFIALIVGLIRPKIVIRWGNQEKRTRGRVFLIYGIAIVTFFIISMVTVPEMTAEERAVYEAEEQKRLEEKQKVKKEKEEAKAKEEAEEKAEKEAKAKAKAEKKKEKEEAKAKAEADEKAEKEAKAKAKAEEKKEKEEAKAKAEADEKAEKEAKARAEAEEKAKKEAAAKKLAEEKAKKEAEAKRLAEEKAVQDAIAKQNEFINTAVEIDYVELARNPDHFVSQKVYFYGKVFQVMEDGNNVTLLVSVTEDSYGIWDDNILVNYTIPKGEGRILDNDIINLWGTVKGIISYESVLGQEITVPEIDGAYIELLGNGS